MVSLLALVLILNSVHVSVDQDGGLTPEQIAAAVDQMQRIWSEAGVALTSGRAGEPAGSEEAVVSLRVVGFAAPRNTRSEPVVAWVSAGVDQALAPILFVSLPTLTDLLANAEFAGYPMRRLTKDIVSRLLGRAIGRVAAHELGHYLLQRSGHARDGLMRPSYTTDDLIGDWLRPFRVSAGDRPRVLTEIATLVRSQHAF